jgi:hypothetical protein
MLLVILFCRISLVIVGLGLSSGVEKILATFEKTNIWQKSYSRTISIILDGDTNCLKEKM